MRYSHGCSEKSKRNSQHPEWRAYCAWLGMRRRCTNETTKDYPNYGGRGITVCPEWSDFKVFYQEMGAPPIGMSIDRIDNDKGYCRANCQWADRKQQSTNRRNRREFTHNGLTMSLTEWARHLGVPRRLLQVRMDRGWSVERMLNPEPANLKDAQQRRRAREKLDRSR